MLTFNPKREWISVTALVAMFLLSLWFYPSLPEVIPIHWDINGQADNFAPKYFGAFILPILSLLLYAGLYFAPLLDPKRESLERSASSYFLIRTITLLFFLVIHGLSLYGATQNDQSLSTSVLMLAMGMLFVILGNYMPRMRPSWIAGIRTPWTMSSEKVWVRTHRLGGWVFVLGGFAICCIAFLPMAWQPPAMISVLAVTVFIPIAYSYWVWQQEQRQLQ